MALTKCPECKREVSSLADKCIHCGYPLTGNTSLAQPASVQTVEMTSKRYKLQKLLAGGLFVLGGMIVLLAYVLARQTYFAYINPFLYAGFIFVAIGFVWSAIVEGRIWWHHS